jgi:hypothetical protein
MQLSAKEYLPTLKLSSNLMLCPNRKKEAIVTALKKTANTNPVVKLMA